MENNMELIVNGIYTTNDERIIIIEEIKEKLMTILNFPRVVMDCNKDVCFVVRNLGAEAKEHYRQHYPSCELFLKLFGDKIDGYLGQLKEE